MIRISKLTDYGIVLLACFSNYPTDQLLTARRLAEISKIPLPTVAKLLKILTHAQILTSDLGVNGGYKMVKTPHQLFLSEILTLFEGPIALTECNRSDGHCTIEKLCPTRNHWKTINDVLLQVLGKLTLADMSNMPIAPLPETPGRCS